MRRPLQIKPGTRARRDGRAEVHCTGVTVTDGAGQISECNAWPLVSGGARVSGRTEDEVLDGGITTVKMEASREVDGRFTSRQADGADRGAATVLKPDERVIALAKTRVVGRL